MTPLRPALLVPLAASLGLHAVMGWGIAHEWKWGAAPSIRTIQISYPESPKTEAPKAKSTNMTAATQGPKKKLKGIPIPRMAAADEPSDFQKKMDAKIKEQEATLKSLSEPRVSTPKARARSSAEIMADPAKGKVFIGYFGEIKKKIQKTLHDRFSHRYSGKGSVTLGFVLNAQGFVEKVAVLPKGTDGDERLHELAIQCLKGSSPFGAFPPGLGSDRIAFNVTIYFDGR
jgi:hypothetical protein